MTRYKMGLRIILLTLILGQFMGNASVLFAAGKNDADQRFIIGSITAKPSKKLPRLEAMSRYLSQALPDAKQFTFDEIVVSSVSNMAELFRNGTVDLVSETPLAAMELVETAGAEIILHEWKKGVAEYSAILITRIDSGITSLDHLKDRVIAFEDPGSTSGFLLPLAMLRSLGYECVELKNVGDRPGPGQIGYVFAHHEINVSALVSRGLVDAGAMSNLDWDDANEVPIGMRKNVQIFYESTPVLRSVVLVRGGLKPSLKNDLIQLFERMHESPDGRKAMKKYNKVRKFNQLTDRYSERLARLQEIHHLIRDKIR